MATYLADKEKVATKTIQKILWHSSEATTERYLYNARKDLEAVMELLGKTGGDVEWADRMPLKTYRARSTVFNH